MEEFFNDLLWVPPFRDLSINRVLVPVSFRNFLFFVILLSFVFAWLILRKKYRPSTVLRKALLTAFFTAGLLYSVQADYIWGTWVADHARVFSGLETEDKLLKTDGKIYAFARAARQSVEGEYELFASPHRAALRTEYFLLPLRKREQAPYIVVIGDNHARFDPATRTFTRNGTTESGFELVLEFSDDAYVLKRKP